MTNTKYRIVEHTYYNNESHYIIEYQDGDDWFRVDGREYSTLIQAKLAIQIYRSEVPMSTRVIDEEEI